MHSAPQATPLLHVTGAPPSAAEPPVVLAAPAVLAPGPLNRLLDRLPPQWISPRTASRSTRARRAPWVRFHGKPLEMRRSLAEADLEAEVKGARISLEVSRARAAALGR